jgi:nitronate monooxygenase
MAGGPSTPDLVVAATASGALGFRAAGYKAPRALAAEIAAVRARTGGAFGVNLFVPGAPTTKPSQLADYQRELEPEAEALGARLGPPTWDDDDWSAKVEVVLDAAPAVCSFTFGCPDAAVIRALRQRDTAVIVTVTSIAEADAAVAAGADGLCLQGIEAGAHRGAFTDDEAPDEQLRALDLLAAVRERVRVPLVIAGGIGGPAAVVSALDAGAAAVQAGTAFLRCDESGAHAVHKAALVDPSFATTALTRSFSGRRARGLANQFMRDHAGAPQAYPEINNMTRPLRAAALQRGDADRTSLWAGTAHRSAREGSAASIVEWLLSDVTRA